MSKGILIVHLVLICCALMLGCISFDQKGFMPGGDPHFSAIGMDCIVLSQAILIVIGLYRNKKGKSAILYFKTNK